MSGFIPRIWLSLGRFKPQPRISFSLPKKNMEPAPGRFTKEVSPSIEKACFSYAANQVRIQIKFNNFPTFPLNSQVEVELIINTRKVKGYLIPLELNLKRKGTIAEIDENIPFNPPVFMGQNINSAVEIKISLVEPFANKNAVICSARFIKKDGKWN